MPDDLENEIEDLLSKIDRFLPEESAFARLRRRWRNRFRRFQHDVARRLSRISLSHVMVAALLMILVGFGLRWTAYGRYALIGGVIILVSAVIISVFTSRATAPEKRWRGQVVDLSGPTFPARVRAWLRRLRRPRY